MKATKLFLTAALSVASTCAFAQFANSGSSLGSKWSSNVDTDSYSRFKISYASETLDASEDYELIEDPVKGVSAEILFGKSISKAYPIFLEYGINGTWGKWTDEDDDDISVNALYVKVPINLAYKFYLTDDLSIDPHVGLGFRVNVLGKLNIDKKDYDFFDKDDFEKDFVWNRFQLGGQVGIGLNYQKLYIGWEYSWSFMELYKKTKTKTNFVSLGVNF